MREGGEGVCGKLLSYANVSRTAKDHFTERACRGYQQDMGQASLHRDMQHVTSCASERNWSLFGNIFSKTKNQKIAYVRGNSREGGFGPDEEIMLSAIDVLD